MGGGKETPRQKLIGLMYLVLMALLAMNVSKSILSAFLTINEKFEHAAELTNGTTEGMMAKIDNKLTEMKSTKAAKEDIKQVELIQAKASEIRELAKSTSNFYVSEAGSMINVCDPLVPVPFYVEDEAGYLKLMNMDTISKKDDYDTAPHLFMKEGTLEPNERGAAIESRLFSFRDSLIQMTAQFEEEKGGKIQKYFIDPSKIKRPHDDHHGVEEYEKSVEEALATVHVEDRARIKRIIDLLTVPEVVHNHHKEYPWVAYQFDHAVIVAAATIFTSLKNDVKMAEAIAIECVSGRVSAPTFKFNKIEPLAFSSTSYINQGDSLGLKVMIAAYDSTEKMELKYWIDDTTRAEGTMKEFKGQAGASLALSGGVGEHNVVGSIAVKEKGVKKWKPWKFKYSVGAPNGAVANSEMNVLYRGWDNKIEVSASGYDPSTVNLSASGGVKISKSKDGFIAKVSGSAKKATLSITAKDKDGKSVKIVDKEFRIFALPKPQAYFANQTFDKPLLSRGLAKAASKLTAKIGDSPLDVKYEVVSFDMVVMKKGQPVSISSKSSKLSGEMKNAIKKMPAKSMLTFTNIKAKGPSGRAQPIGGLSFKLK
ncbi:MAG: hypothetical protein N4A35_02245 [Flavobacteriales bacterium]|jgi:gliding motility-associated protein GldM|nr:hypothetical protein [Flavobacteriales bacterium]